MGRTGRLYALAAPKLSSSSASYLSRSSISQVAFRYQRPTQLQQFRNGSFSPRSFSTTSARPAKTIQQMKSRQRTGPFSWKAALLFVLTGAGMIIYFRVEKARLERKRITEMSKGVGRPKVGGPFVLKDLEGKEFTAEDLKGKYSFVCPSPPPLCLQTTVLIFGSWGERYTLASRTAPTSVPTNLTKWPP
jgi:protein SCO1/2